MQLYRHKIIFNTYLFIFLIFTLPNKSCIHQHKTNSFFSLRLDVILNNYYCNEIIYNKKKKSRGILYNIHINYNTLDFTTRVFLFVIYYSFFFFIYCFFITRTEFFLNYYCYIRVL